MYARAEWHLGVPYMLGKMFNAITALRKIVFEHLVHFLKAGQNISYLLELRSLGSPRLTQIHRMGTFDDNLYFS